MEAFARASVLAAAALLCFSAVPAAGDGPKLPAFGANRFHAAIRAATAAPDADDYVAPLVQGEKLTVTVKSDRGSTLVPKLTLVTPGGDEITPTPLVSRSRGAYLALTNWPVPTTGRWTVRLSGADGTEGAYGVTFGVKLPPALKPKAPQTVTPGGIAFEAVEGAWLDLTITWKDAAANLRVDSIVGASGAPLVGVEAGVAKRSLTMRKFALHGGDGTYVLHLTTQVPAATFKLNLKVTPQGRPKPGKIVQLSADEPALDGVDTPLRGVDGAPVLLSGKNFDPAKPPTVLFGSLPAAVTVLNGGTTLSVVPPPLLLGSTVDVVVIAQDGQFVAAEDYFHYATTPSLIDLVNASNAPTHAGPVGGGATLFLTGGGFEAGQIVWFGTTQATGLVVVNAGRMSVQVPAASGPGPVAVFVENEFGRQSATSVTYTYQ